MLNDPAIVCMRNRARNGLRVRVRTAASMCRYCVRYRFFGPPDGIGILPRSKQVAPTFVVLFIISTSGTTFLPGGGDLWLYPCSEIRAAFIDMV